MKRGETTEFIASKLDVSLQKVLSTVAELPIKKYTIYEANRSNVEHVMFLESKAFNEILDWNRPIYYVGQQLPPPRTIGPVVRFPV